MISVSESVAADRRSDPGATDQNRRSETVAAVYDRRNDPVSPLGSAGAHRPPLQVLLPLHLQTSCANC
jgi:hypothetical protein